MLKTKNSFVIAASLFLTAEVALGISLQLVSGILGRLLSFSAVALAAAFAALLYERTREFFLTEAALILTAMADAFLVLCDPPMRLGGMIFFSLVQICYFLRIYIKSESAVIARIHITVRVLLLAGASVITFVVLGEAADALSFISVLYFANLALNIVFSFVGIKRNIAFSLGLVLFILCDTFIGFSMIEAYLPLEEGRFFYWLAHPGFNVAWVFYVPSQALLAISAYSDKT